MATFSPFKRHILGELDALVDLHGLNGPFLDAGCGRGDVALRLARRGWHGVALDMSDTALEFARRALADTPGVEVVHGDLFGYRGGPFATIVMLDVLEHIEADRQTLDVVAGMQRPGDHLVMTIPTNPDREWRWDDDVYGHVRRYAPCEIRDLLAAAGYRVVEMWDITFPVLWLLRRAYTALKSAPPITGTAEERSRASAGVRTWDLGSVVTGLATHCLPWNLLSSWIRRNRHQYDRGHEVIVLARRVRDGSAAAD